MPRIEYKNRGTSHQDHVLAKAFKKQILRLNLEPIFSHGYVPIWRKKNREYIVADFEYAHADCYVLPVAGETSFRSILNAIRREKPLPFLENKTTAGESIKKPFSELTEADLVRALKQLSLVVFSSEDSGCWKHDLNGQKTIILKAEQLRQEGRLGRVPLRPLITGYVKHFQQHKELNNDAERQMLNEHRLTSDEVDMFANLAKKLRLDLDKAGKTDRTKRMRLIRAVNKQIVEFCDEIDRGRRGAPAAALPCPAPPVITEDPELKKESEINALMRRLNQLQRKQYKTNAELDMIVAIRDDLRRVYGLTTEQIDESLAYLRRRK